jgi:hypothetical protein
VNALQKANMELDLEFARMREQAERAMRRDVPPEMWDVVQKKRREIEAALARCPEGWRDLKDVVAKETLEAYHAGVSPVVLAYLTDGIGNGGVDYVPPY